MADGYEVGFGKPPKSSRFEKGISGNPKGRPKGSRDLAATLSRALREKVVINENGRRRTITKLDAAIKQLVNKSAGGDLAAMRHLITLVPSIDDQVADSLEENVSEIDLEIIRTVLKRTKDCLKEDGHEA